MKEAPAIEIVLKNSRPKLKQRARWGVTAYIEVPFQYGVNVTDQLEHVKREFLKAFDPNNEYVIAWLGENSRVMVKTGTTACGD